MPKDNVTPLNGASAEFNLDTLLAQREEARGGNGREVEFTFKDEKYTFLDPQFMTDDEKAELNELSKDDDFTDVDLAAWYMGDEQYDAFCAAGGNASMFFVGFRMYTEKIAQENSAGKASRPNRSSRRRQRS